MPERHSLFDTFADQIAPVHADGYKFLAIAAGLTLLSFLIWSPLGWLGALVTAGIAYFFRDPARVTPLRDGLVIAPGDGKIAAIERVLPPAELGLGDSQRLRISIFLSIFDVHINRAPVAGRILRSVYVQGSFINAAADKASATARQCTFRTMFRLHLCLSCRGPPFSEVRGPVLSALMIAIVSGTRPD